ncbi:MAG: SIMPL domain-containing protein [Acidobacteriia bacterium]|nr:SIMPL domain-containing protein [Terriglobia bacterium]
MPLLAQINDNSITVTASQNATAQPDEVVFSVVVGSGLDQTLDTIVNAVSSVGITGADLVNLVAGNSPLTCVALGPQQCSPPPPEQWSFQLVVPFSKIKDTTAALAGLQSSIGNTTAGLSLSFSIAGTQSSVQSSVCDLASLVTQARTNAQQIASAASVTPGAVIGLSSYTSQCSLQARFALGSTQSGTNSISIVATRPNPATPDQTTVNISVTSGVSATLDTITGALSTAGITGFTFDGVNTYSVTQPSGTQQATLRWTFAETIAFTNLKTTLSQLSAAAKNFGGQNSGLGLAFQAGGVSISQTPACPEAGLIADAKAQAQKVAAAAGVTAGPVISLNMANAGGSYSPAYGESFSFISGVFTTGLIFPAPISISTPSCTLTARFQLL